MRAPILGPSVKADVLPSIKVYEAADTPVFLPSQWGPVLRDQFLRNSCNLGKRR